MKKFLFAFVLFLLGNSVVNAQALNDTLPPYKKTNQLPAFKILQSDSSWFTNKDLPKNEAVVLIYFSPECGHCQITAKEIVKNMSKLKDVFFLMVSYHAPDAIRKFAQEYKLDHFSNVRLGRDPSYSIPSFYRVKFTPFMAAYNKQGKFVQSWEQGTDAETLVKLLEHQ